MNKWIYFAAGAVVGGAAAFFGTSAYYKKKIEEHDAQITEIAKRYSSAPSETAPEAPESTQENVSDTPAQQDDATLESMLVLQEKYRSKHWNDMEHDGILPNGVEDLYADTQDPDVFPKEG